MPSLNLEYIYYHIYLLLTGQILNGATLWQRLADFAARITPFSTIFSLLFLVGIIYCATRLNKIEEEMIEAIGNQPLRSTLDSPNRRWQRIIDHLNSDNESDWRLAILEADLILEEMLEKMGYAGATIGEKLQGIERSDFNSIDDAWEAHKIRNLVAHEGGDFRIDNRGARRVITLYEKAFKEFHFI